MSGNEEEKDSGQELRQTHKPEIERALGDLVDLPADRNRLHFRCEDDAKAGRLKKYKAGILERDAAGGVGVFGCGHRALLCHKNKVGTSSGECGRIVA
jgi:hypothetical protein